MRSIRAMRSRSRAIAGEEGPGEDCAAADAAAGLPGIGLPGIGLSGMVRAVNIVRT